jgi:hypothetical protein
MNAFVKFLYCFAGPTTEHRYRAVRKPASNQDNISSWILSSVTEIVRGFLQTPCKFWGKYLTLGHHHVPSISLLVPNSTQTIPIVETVVK